jgi:hypothetical protein
MAELQTSQALTGMARKVKKVARPVMPSPESVAYTGGEGNQQP